MKKMLLLVFVAVVGVGGFLFYAIFMQTAGRAKKDIEIYIYPHQSYASFRDTLLEKLGIRYPLLFDGLAWWKKLDKRFKPGRYVVRPDITLNELMNMFISGRQTPLRVFISSFRTTEELLQKFDRNLLCGKDSLRRLLEDSAFCKKLGFTTENVRVLFLPLVYEIYWATPCKEVLWLFKKEYDRFWNSTRREKAKAVGLSPEEVMILASIVEAETSRPEEMPTIAGVYINRLRKSMKLEADPTVIYAWGDFTIKRVLKKHLEIQSPYNTYLHAGLPPGPIRQPSLKAIDAVLNYEKHDYLFFCAREDFSGYHRFARTASEHAKNARKYQQALTERMKKRAL